MGDFKVINGRLQATPKKERLGNLAPAINADEAVIKSQYDLLQTQINNIESGSISLTTIEAGDGAAATPSYTFAADLDTGIYRIGSNEIGIGVNGTKILDIGTSGLGIGYSGSSALLDVYPTTAAKGRLRLSAADSAGDTITTITNASQSGARTYTIPDGGGNANFVLTTSPGSVVGARCTSEFDATSGTTGTTLTAVTGMSVNLIAGAIYAIDVYIGGTSTANSGMKLALGGTATWTSVDSTAAYYTASAVAVGHNATATPGTAIGGATAANIYATIKATIVVNAAGTLTLMAAQNASHVDTTSVYVNSYITAKRIS